MPHKENRLLAVLISDLLEKTTVPRTVGYKENQLPLVLISNLLGRPTSKENRLPTIAISNLLSQKLSSWTRNYKENRLPAVLISNLLEKITVPPDSWIQRKPASAGSHFQAFKPKIVLMDNFCSLKPIYIRIDFLDVFVIIEGVVEFFKGC